MYTKKCNHCFILKIVLYNENCPNFFVFFLSLTSGTVGTVEALGAGSGSTHLCLRDLLSKMKVSCVDVFQKLQSVQCRARSLQMATRGRQPQEGQRDALKGRKKLKKLFEYVFNGTLIQCFCSEDNNIKEGGGEDEAVCV